MHPDKLDLACRRALPAGWQHRVVVDVEMVRRYAAACLSGADFDELETTSNALHNPCFASLSLLGLSEKATPTEVFAAYHLTRKWVDAKIERVEREIKELRGNTRAKARLADAQAWLAAYNGIFRAVESAFSELRVSIGSQQPV